MLAWREAVVAGYGAHCFLWGVLSRREEQQDKEEEEEEVELGGGERGRKGDKIRRGENRCYVMRGMYEE